MLHSTHDALKRCPQCGAPVRTLLGKWICPECDWFEDKASGIENLTEVRKPGEKRLWGPEWFPRKGE